MAPTTSKRSVSPRRALDLLADLGISPKDFADLGIGLPDGPLTYEQLDAVRDLVLEDRAHQNGEEIVDKLRAENSTDPELVEFFVEEPPARSGEEPDCPCGIGQWTRRAARRRLALRRPEGQSRSVAVSQDPFP
jgi:hypothetical protein